ncbi:hypothetical protein MMC28_008973 [Mycoblastus sanguinarius]|nr:hypothetical protein [Mycoblastus sanguinarius]
MSSQVEAPHKNSRRSRRPPRKSAGPTLSQTPDTQIAANLSEDTNPDRLRDQPIRILRRGDPDTASNIISAIPVEITHPTTPPRPRSMYEDFTNNQHAGNESAPEISQKKNNPRSKGRKLNRPTSPMPGFNGTPSRPQSLTPGRANETPVKAYAGPTFHASPAASSLPIPKFFSKSVPNVDQTSSLKTMMEQETSGTASESDGSPFLENAQPTQDHRAREESPLDIFFRADREAKAKGGTGSAIKASAGDIRDLGIPPYRNNARHHSRHPTDSSIGGIFPLEMDGVAPEPLTSPEPTPNAIDSTNGEVPAHYFSPSLNEVDREEQRRKAQTLALKKLLYSPRPQRPASSPLSGSSISVQSNGSSAPAQQHGSPSRNRSKLSGSVYQLESDEGSKDQRQATLLALAEKQIQTRVGQRQPSSNLCKDSTLSQSPGNANLPKLPATPTPSRAHNPSATSKSNALRQAYESPHTPFHPSTKPSGGLDVTSSRSLLNAKSMEDDLRRILKLEVLGNDSVTGIRS